MSKGQPVIDGNDIMEKTIGRDQTSKGPEGVVELDRKREAMGGSSWRRRMTLLGEEC